MQRTVPHRLLAFSRRQTLDPKPVKPNVLVGDMLELIARTLGPLIEITTKLDPDVESTLCDPPQLENALINLSINARDAMPNGGTLTIETENLSLNERHARLQDLPEGDYVSIAVTDSGCGMSPEVMRRAFDPFFTTKPIGQGTGLGLSMVYGFTRQSGGKVTIESVEGKGTTIRLLLPRLAGSAQEKSVDRQTPHFKPLPVQKTILVVDDEASIRALAAEVLKEDGFNVIEASDGKAGLSVLESDVVIDVLVTDIGMPGMNGKEMADRARQRRREIPVIYITGYAEKAVFGTGNVEEGARLLIKPFTMDDLIAEVRSVIESMKSSQ
jgi:CheY-like chemotaxis protein